MGMNHMKLSVHCYKKFLALLSYLLLYLLFTTFASIKRFTIILIVGSLYTLRLFISQTEFFLSSQSSFKKKQENYIKR